MNLNKFSLEQDETAVNLIVSPFFIELPFITMQFSQLRVPLIGTNNCCRGETLLKTQLKHIIPSLVCFSLRLLPPCFLL